MKRKIIISSIIFLFSLYFIKLLVPKLRIDGYYSLLCELTSTDSENTRYAEDYTDKKFLSLKNGMTESQVIGVIGKPISIWNNSKIKGEYILMYSESPTGQDYRMRKVMIKDSIVVNVFGFYYND